MRDIAQCRLPAVVIVWGRDVPVKNPMLTFISPRPDSLMILSYGLRMARSRSTGVPTMSKSLYTLVGE